MENQFKQKVQRRKAGGIVVGCGAGILILGYVLLARGSITAAPILIIGSFGVLALGIFLGWD